MEVSADVTVEGDLGIDKMIANLKQLDGKKVSAGLFGGFASKKAMWQEYGTSRGIPSRPFLRNTLYENEARWGNEIAPMVITMMMNGGGSETVMSKLGERMQNDIKKTIDAGNFAPLAASTVVRKGSSKPLVDTGDMYGSITWREG